MADTHPSFAASSEQEFLDNPNADCAASMTDHSNSPNADRSHALPEVEPCEPTDSEAHVTATIVDEDQQLIVHNTASEDSIPSDASIHSDELDEQLDPGHDALAVAEPVEERSWVFRFVFFFVSAAEWMLGCVTLITLLAVASAIPFVQFLTFGYLLECARRVTETGKFWKGAVGVRRAARIGSLALGTWICILPIQYVSSLWYASNLIDPTSTSTQILRFLQLSFALLIVPHVIASWYCGGRLRQFFWPALAPFTCTLWAIRKMADTPTLRPLLNSLLGWISPRLVEDLCRARPLTDWFLPAVLVKGVFGGTLLKDARDGLWNFVEGLQLPRLFWLGIRGFVGTTAWMAAPTLLLIGISTLPPGLAALSGFLGIVSLSIVLLYVPYAQAQFARVGKLHAMFDFGELRTAFRGSPILHLLALLFLLLISLPLFLFKIERIPSELLWLPGVFFIVSMWPARTFVAWAYAKGTRRPRPRRFFLTWPVRGLQLPLTLAFVLFVLLSQYVAWNGSLGMLEHHIVSVPAPFTQLP